MTMKANSKKLFWPEDGTVALIKYQLMSETTCLTGAHNVRNEPKKSLVPHMSLILITQDSP